MFSATVEQRDGSYILHIPSEELEVGAVEEGETYRVAMFPGIENLNQPAASESTNPEEKGRDSDDTAPDSHRGGPEPPVSEGETRVVEIEDIGEQGDGIARVERGYVVIVPDTEQGERVRIEITDVSRNVAFAEVVERLSYYE